MRKCLLSNRNVKMLSAKEKTKRPTRKAAREKESIKTRFKMIPKSPVAPKRSETRLMRRKKNWLLDAGCLLDPGKARYNPIISSTDILSLIGMSDTCESFR